MRVQCVLTKLHYRKLKIPLKVNCNLKSKTAAACVGIEVIVLFVLQLLKLRVMFIIAHSSMTRYELFFCFAEQSLGTLDLGMHVL